MAKPNTNRAAHEFDASTFRSSMNDCSSLAFDNRRNSSNLDRVIKVFVLLYAIIGSWKYQKREGNKHRLCGYTRSNFQVVWVKVPQAAILLGLSSVILPPTSLACNKRRTPIGTSFVPWGQKPATNNNNHQKIHNPFNEQGTIDTKQQNVLEANYTIHTLPLHHW